MRLSVLFNYTNPAPSDYRKPTENKPKHKEDELRSYGTGAQILSDLGIHNMTLLTNSKKAVIGLEGYGIRISGHKKL